MNIDNTIPEAVKLNGQPSTFPHGFDLGSLRLSQNFEADLGVTKAIITVPVRKPDKQTFIRVHPDTDYRMDTSVLELKDDRESYY